MKTKIVEYIKEKNLKYRKPKQGKGGGQFSLDIPMEYIKLMGIDPDNKAVQLLYNPVTQELKITKL